ncbi:MAG: class I SAM-dependent methyltransferase [Anaerolineae bacterium]|nr:class I SAM-dependent methyltransferase [Gemmatimonadaceae bacterium]
MRSQLSRVPELYDRIGQSYSAHRQEDPRLALAVRTALGPARSVVNVGAGAGSYEPKDLAVVAVEPSSTMIAQRGVRAAPVVQAKAEALPFGDQAFDAAMAILTVHHWRDRRQGLAECARVAKLVVCLTWDPECDGFWLTQEYFPEILAMDRCTFPALSELREELGVLNMQRFPIPADCTDGFLGAYWRRPHEYLEASVRANISSLAAVDTGDVRLARLRADLESGRWQRRYGHLLDLPSLDIGYCLVTAALNRVE